MSDETEATPAKGGGGKAALAALALVGLLAASRLLPIADWLLAFLEYTRSLGPKGPALLAAVYVVACVLLLPGSILTLGAGFVFGLGVGLVAVSIGSTLGAGAAFLVGRYLARGWVEGQMTSHPKLAAVDAAVEKEGFKIVFLTRLSPIFPFNLLNYFYGVTRVRFRDYMLASWVGMLPGTVMFVYIGSVTADLATLAGGGGGGGGAGRTALTVLGFAATVAVTVKITQIARKALDEALGGEDEAAGAGDGEPAAAREAGAAMESSGEGDPAREEA